MAGNGSPRRSTPARRMLVGAIRVAALFSIIVGISGALVPSLTRSPAFFAATAAFAILTFFLLRPPRPAIPAPPSTALLPVVAKPAEPVVVIDESRIAAAREEEKSRWASELAKSAETVRRVRQELATSEEARGVLKHNMEELTQTIAAVRQQTAAQQEAAKQQLAHSESLATKLKSEIASAREEVERLRAEQQELKRLAADRESEWSDKLAKAVEGIESDHERELADRDRKVAETQRALENERGIREQVATLAKELQQQVGQSAAAQGDTRQKHEAEIAELRRQLDDRRKEIETERAAREQVAAIAIGHEKEVASAKAERDAAIAAGRATAARFTELQRTVEAEHAAAQQREADWNTRLQAAVDAATAQHRPVQQQLEEALQQAKSSHDETVARLLSERDESKSALAALTAHGEALQQEFDAERGQHAAKVRELEARLEHAMENAQDDLRRAIEQRDAARAESSGAVARVRELEALLERERAEWASRAEKLAADHQANLAGAHEQHESARVESTGALARIAELEETLERERSERAAVVADHENDIARLHEQHETVRAEFATTFDRERSNWNDKLQKIVSGMASDHENDLGRAIEERESARAEGRERSMKIAELQQTLERERAEWNDKLQHIVSGIAADHENDIGEAVVEREAARAESRHLSSRVQELQRQVDELKSGPAAPPVDEAALRQKLDAEWSEKLQTIVMHLASDHDADIGKALEEKEAARAELRTMSMKVTQLQQQIDRDRQLFLGAEQKWSSMRDSLTSKVTALQSELERVRATPAAEPETPEPFAPAEPFAAPAPLPTPEPFPSPLVIPHAEIDHERARADVLEFAEQAHAVLKRTAPGSIALPRDDRRTLILFVHHDPNMRTMWRDQLHKHGYDVITAADGLEGLRIASAQKPNIVIADAQMPKMDGRELCRMIKSNGETASTKVVLMSGVYSDEPANDGFPPDEILRKPVKFDALHAAVTTLLATTS